MTQHRYPCTAEPPDLKLAIEPNQDAVAVHIHACVHDAVPFPDGQTVEHECSCGMTWRTAPTKYGQGAYQWAPVEGFWTRVRRAITGVRQ